MRSKHDQASDAEEMLDTIAEDDDLRSSAIDAITNIRHLADREGWDWDAMMFMVDIHHEEER